MTNIQFTQLPSKWYSVTAKLPDGSIKMYLAPNNRVGLIRATNYYIRLRTSLENLN